MVGLILSMFLLVGCGPFVGKAVETLQDEAILLDILPYEEIALQVPTVDFNITTSGAEYSEKFTIYIEAIENNLIKYDLRDKENIPIIIGLLDTSVKSSTGAIYLDEDDIGDVTLSFDGVYLKITNDNYVAPSAIQIEVLDENGGLLPDPWVVGEEETFDVVIKATSSIVPSVTDVKLDGVSILSDLEPSENDGAKAFYDLEITSGEAGISELSVTAIVGVQEVVKNFTIGVGSVIYSLKDTSLVNISVVSKKYAGKQGYSIEYTFADTTKLQPFSVPCNDNLVITSFDPKKAIDLVSHYSGSYTEGFDHIAPSDFKQLEPFKGYQLKLKENEGPLVMEAKCIASEPNAPPIKVSDYSAPPTLIKGWNIVGVRGLVPIAQSKLVNTPVTTSVTEVYALSNLGEVLTTEDLIPGKAYWVLVE